MGRSLHRARHHFVFIPHRIVSTRLNRLRRMAALVAAKSEAKLTRQLILYENEATEEIRKLPRLGKVGALPR